SVNVTAPGFSASCTSGVCQYPFSRGTVVSVGASLNFDWSFLRWDGTYASPVNVTLLQDITETAALYRPIVPDVISGSGTLTLTGTLDGQSVSYSCNETACPQGHVWAFDYNSSVTVTAAPLFSGAQVAWIGIPGSFVPGTKYSFWIDQLG